MSRLNNLKNRENHRVVHTRTRDEREPSRHRGLVLFTATLLIGGLVYLIFFSGLLDIKSTEISGYGNPAIIGEIIESHRAASPLNNNILFFNNNDLVDAIKGDSGVQSVVIKKVLPNTLRVDIVQSKSAIVWNTAGESFILDDRGYVIEKNNIENLPVVFDNENIAANLGERVASPTLIKYITDMWVNFDPVTGHEIDRIIILDIFSDIHVQSKSGWTAYFDSSKDPVSQLENLNKILRTVEKDSGKKLEYIDMRLDSRVYYK
jgi:cell division septal protein FtsQ